jgi:hypothetical protein
MRPTSCWKPNKVVNCTFVTARKDMVIWSKIGGHIADSYRPISVLDSESNHESIATFALRIYENDVEIK